ncbi:hypothetical protein GCM10025857_08220 [Alicyclobacillus contaminans]|nr:hypothetical protein GCM10025857_08220 [Alicyclobacillus contaminans]
MDTLSPDLTEARIPGTEGYGVDGITAFMRQGSTWYVGTLTGNLLVGQGGHWQNHSYGLPNRTIVQVAPLPDRSTDTGIAVGFAGYASATPDHPGHVYETTDGGQTWRDISGNLPDAPVQWLADVEDDTGRRLVVKMAGRWFCLTSSRHWVAWQGTD